MPYKIENLVKDASVKKAINKALTDDGRLSFSEVKTILASALDGKGLRLQEFKDLQAILKTAKTLDDRSKLLIDNFLRKHYRPPVPQRSGQKLTKNFSLSEFACKDGTQVPNNLLSNVKELAANLQVLRGSYNLPIRINSAYRTPSHNKSVGGASQSQHLLAKAADIVIGGVAPISIKARVEQLIKNKKMKEGGIGVYNSFLHYDIRGSKARW